MLFYLYQTYSKLQHGTHCDLHVERTVQSIKSRHNILEALCAYCNCCLWLWKSVVSVIPLRVQITEHIPGFKVSGKSSWLCKGPPTLFTWEWTLSCNVQLTNEGIYQGHSFSYYNSNHMHNAIAWLLLEFLCFLTRGTGKLVKSELMAKHLILWNKWHCEILHKPVCLLMCLFNAPFVLNAYVHPLYVHVKSRWLLWVSMWAFSTYTLSQKMSQV